MLFGGGVVGLNGGGWVGVGGWWWWWWGRNIGSEDYPDPTTN